MHRGWWFHNALPRDTGCTHRLTSSDCDTCCANSATRTPRSGLSVRGSTVSTLACLTSLCLSPQWQRIDQTLCRLMSQPGLRRPLSRRWHCSRRRESLPPLRLGSLPGRTYRCWRRVQGTWMQEPTFASCVPWLAWRDAKPRRPPMRLPHSSVVTMILVLPRRERHGSMPRPVSLPPSCAAAGARRLRWGNPARHAVP